MAKRIVKHIENFKRTKLHYFERLLSTRTVKFFGVALIALVITMITTASMQTFPEKWEEGAIATRDIKSDRNYELVDEEATKKSKEDAEAAVTPIYDFYDELADQLATKVETAFTNAREEVEQIRKSLPIKKRKRKAFITPEQEEILRKDFEDKIGIKVSDDEWDGLLENGFSKRVGLATAMLVKRFMKNPISADQSVIEEEKDRGITIRRVRRSDGEMVVDKEWQVKDIDGIKSLEKTKEELKKTDLKQTMFGTQVTKAIGTISEKMIEPNLFFNRVETENRKKQAVADVKSSILKIKAGEMIIRNGARYDKWHIKVLTAIQKEKTKGTFSREFAGTWLLAVLILIIPFGMARRFIHNFHPTRLDYILMASVGFAILALMRVMMVILPALRDSFFVNVPDSALIYIIPLAGGAMLIRMLLSVEVTLFFALVLSLCSALFVQTGIEFTTFVMLSSIVAMHTIANVDRRSLIMKAGLITGAVNVLIVIGIRLIGMVNVTEAVTSAGMTWCAIFAFLGGLGSAVLVMVSVPIIESVMNYTTDIKLLELANLNHPLLRELIVSAPGTYHHAHLVGILGEAAAEAINANALLVRVGAYYHDIGKMRKPQYFIENARNGENRHEKLTPSMSALIIQAHVKEGVEMAQAARLPKVIIDMIPQHHGTRMIGFFYEKAKAAEDPEIQKIDKKNFQYPGPKPQTREAAILMLADVVEAQVRSLKEKSPSRIEQTVRKIIDDVFRESQLDECELTLKDLDDIHNAFVRILLGIYHHRIEYPEKEKTENSRENMGGVSKEESKNVSDVKKDIEESGKGKRS